MASYKELLTPAREEKIARYCVNNNLDLKLSNIISVVTDCFKYHPIFNQAKGCSTPYDATPDVAEMIYKSKITLERIQNLIREKKPEWDKDRWAKNIEAANFRHTPDLDKLVENLMLLNIVDGQSRLALVCFLMQLKYTRDKKFPNDDKTCVFFHGEARDGKTATAKAICAVEGQYGLIHEATSGKDFTDGHNEDIWKSHVNFCDEVMPNDISREILLKNINSGNVSLNPKCEKRYKYKDVNTNNIFTSNRQIYQMQRRVSVIEFGKPKDTVLPPGTLENCINNIFDSLPDHKYYHDLYIKVSTYNSKRENALAISTLTKFLFEKFDKIKYWDSDGASETRDITFTMSHIYDLIRDKRSNLVVWEEYKSALKFLVKMFMEKGYITVGEKYKKCTTPFYSISRENYQRMMHEMEEPEPIEEITGAELKELLSPYFGITPAPVTISLTKTSYLASDNIFIQADKHKIQGVNFIAGDEFGKYEVLNRPKTEPSEATHPEGVELNRFLVANDLKTALRVQRIFVDNYKNIMFRAVESGDDPIHCIFRLSPQKSTMLANVEEYKLFYNQFIKWLSFPIPLKTDPVGFKTPNCLTYHPKANRCEKPYVYNQQTHYDKTAFIPDDVADDLYKKMLLVKNAELEDLQRRIADLTKVSE